MSYAHPEFLVDTQWLVDHMNDLDVRIAVLVYDPISNYNLGHVPVAVVYDWKKNIYD